VGLLLGVEERLLFPRLGVALCVPGEAQRLLLGAADGFGGDPLPVGQPHGEQQGAHHRRDQRRDDDVDEV